MADVPGPGAFALTLMVRPPYPVRPSSWHDHSRPNALDIEGWIAWLRARRYRRKGWKKARQLGDKSVRDHLNSLSNLYRRAMSEGHVPPGFNPVMAMLDKPSGRTKGEARWLEVPDAACLIA